MSRASVWLKMCQKQPKIIFFKKWAVWYIGSETRGAGLFFRCKCNEEYLLKDCYLSRLSCENFQPCMKAQEKVVKIAEALDNLSLFLLS